MRARVAVILCLIAFTLSKIEEIDEEQFAEIVLQVPGCERYAFLRTHILRGYELYNEPSDLLDNLDDESKLSLAIYTFLYDHQDNIEMTRLKVQTNDTVCLPSIGCIDPGDSVVRPTRMKKE